MFIKDFLFEPYQFAVRTILKNKKVLLPLFSFYIIVMTLLSCLFFFQIPQPEYKQSQTVSYETKEGQTITKTTTESGYEYPVSYGALAILGAMLLCSIYNRYVWSILTVHYFKEETIHWREIANLHNFKVFFKYFISQILFILKLSIKSFFLIIPGIYHLVEQYFVGIPLLKNSNLSISEDRKQAQALTLLNRFKVLIFALLNGCLGLLFLTPITVIASVYLEEKLRKNRKSNSSTS